MTAELLLDKNQTLHFVSSGFGFEPRIHAKAGGGKIYQGVPVFRSGSFADSMGRRNTWEDLHIKQMVENLSHLNKNNILQSVPVRDGHPGWLIHGLPGNGEVVGWHENVTTEVRKSPVDGNEYTYLLADYSVDLPRALDNIQNGLWRNRSAEIGGWTTNNESEFWPVYLGFAFVDFGAVEGLNFSHQQGNRSYIIFGENPLREKNVGDNTQGTQQPLLSFGVPQPPAQPAAPAPFVFSIGGRNVTDPTEVQRHISTLEAFTTETRAAARRDFVASLVSGNKLLATQQEGQTAFALGLTDEQFAQWKTGWEGTPASSVLANHGSGTVPANAGGPTAENKAQDAIEVAKQTVAMHRLNGMKDEQLRQTNSYKALVIAGIEK